MKIYHAFYDSRSFCFEAYGTSADDARHHLIMGLNKHMMQYNLSIDWYESYAIEVDEYELNTPYRGKEIL